MTAKWDALDIALLETMIHQGKSSKEIAEALGEGVTPEVVRQQAHRRGFKRRTVLQRAGKPVNEEDGLLARIAARAGLSPERDTVALPVDEAALDAWLRDPTTFFEWL